MKKLIPFANACVMLFAVSTAYGLATPQTQVVGTAATPAGTTDDTAFPLVTTGDVLEGLTVNTSGYDNSFDSNPGPAGLTDGSLGQNNTSVFDGSAFSVTGYTAEITLASPTDIGTIETYAGWADDRIDQVYTLWYTTAATPTLSTTPADPGSGWTEIGSVDYDPGASNGYSGAGSSTLVTWGGSGSLTGGADATGLEWVLTSSDGSQSHAPVLREFSAYEVADVPEPSTMWLIAAGGAGLLILFRRMPARRS